MKLELIRELNEASFARNGKKFDPLYRGDLKRFADDLYALSDKFKVALESMDEEVKPDKVAPETREVFASIIKRLDDLYEEINEYPLYNDYGY